MSVVIGTLTSENVYVGARIELCMPGRMLGAYAIGTVIEIETDEWTPGVVTITMREDGIHGDAVMRRVLGGREGCRAKLLCS